MTRLTLNMMGGELICGRATMDGGVVTWGGGTGTGNMISSTESCQHGCGGVGAHANEWAAMGCMHLP